MTDLQRGEKIRKKTNEETRISTLLGDSFLVNKEGPLRSGEQPREGLDIKGRPIVFPGKRIGEAKTKYMTSLKTKCEKERRKRRSGVGVTRGEERCCRKRRGSRDGGAREGTRMQTSLLHFLNPGGGGGVRTRGEEKADSGDRKCRGLKGMKGRGERVRQERREGRSKEMATKKTKKGKKKKKRA